MKKRNGQVFQLDQQDEGLEISILHSAEIRRKCDKWLAKRGIFVSFNQYYPVAKSNEKPTKK